MELHARAHGGSAINNVTNKTGKMSYLELVEFSSWLTVIDSQHKCPLNLMICISFSLMIISLASEGQQLENGKHFQEIRIYQPECIVYSALFFATLTKSLSCFFKYCIGASKQIRTF